MAVVIPPRRHRTTSREVDEFIDKERLLIECFFNQIKHFQSIFARHAKTSRNSMGMLRCVSALIWLR